MANDVLLRLTGARDLLMQRGVNRNGTYVRNIAELNDRRCFCSVGAIAAAFNPHMPMDQFGRELTACWMGNGPARKATQMLQEAIGAASDHNIFEWNDHSQSDAEVIAAFDKAIATAACLDV